MTISYALKKTMPAQSTKVSRRTRNIQVRRRTQITHDRRRT